MKWIRSPSYDLFWLVTAPLVLILPLPFLLTVNFGHVLAPIALAWNHRGYRAVMLQRPGKFIGVPMLIMGGGLVVAVTTWLLFPDFTPGAMALENFRLDQVAVPMVLWANLYAVWNLYHIGAQNFGFLSLYRRKGFAGKGRYVALGSAVLAMVLVRHYGILSLYVAGWITTNHWLAAIGLSAHVHSHHHECSPLWFVGTILVAAFLLVLLFDAGLWLSGRVAILDLCLRGALGIWHFLQDRWLWRFSDPQVRATIGQELFA